MKKENATMSSKRSNEFDMTMAEFKGSVLAQLQQIQGDIGEMRTQVSGYCTKTDVRITALELWKTDIMAKVAVIVGIFTIGINLIWDSIKQRFFKN
jgi:hypothetical protein